MRRCRAARAARVLAVSVGLAILGMSLASSAVAASPGWKILGATGPTNLPPRQSEVQRVTVEAEGGTFTLSRVTGEGEGTLSYGSGTALSYASGASSITFLFVTAGTAFTTGQEVTAGPGVAPGTTVTNVSADGKTIDLSTPTTAAGSFASVEAASKEVTGLTGVNGGFHVGDPVTGLGIPAGTTVSSVSGSTLILSNYPTLAGPKALSATETTAPIDHDSQHADLQGALEALPAYPAGSVTVTGGPGGDEDHPYFIQFDGPPYANQNVTQFTATGSFPESGDRVVIATTVPGGPGEGTIAIYATNVGGAASSGTETLTVGPLPAGISFGASASGSGWTCSPPSPPDILTCGRSTPVPADKSALALKVPLLVNAVPAIASSVKVAIVGGGAAKESTYLVPLVVSTERAQPGIQAFWAGVFDEDGEPSSQAGGHPAFAGSMFFLNTFEAPNGRINPAGDVKDVVVDLPHGFIANPQITKRCPNYLPIPIEDTPLDCTGEAIVGDATPLLQRFPPMMAPFSEPSPVYNDVPPTGWAAEFTFPALTGRQSIFATIRSNDDYGAMALAPSVPTEYSVYGSLVSLSGKPAAAGGRAFLTNPTDCALEATRPSNTVISADAWHQPDIFDDATVQNEPVKGCDELVFEPEFSFQPSSTRAATGVAATAHIHVDQHGLLGLDDDGKVDPEALAPPHLKDTVVTLPEGLTLNPAAANGLGACSMGQIGLITTTGALPNPIRFNKESVTCPEASKIGTATVETPLLEDALRGTIYLAAQEENPFHSLLAMYLVIDDPKTGIVVKLPGEVRPDPTTGQLTATFDNNPQLPFEDLTLKFRGGGPRSELATPEVCGTYTTHSSWTPDSAPESGPPAQTTDSFTISDSCAASPGARPFSPGFDAGTVGTQAGSYSPLVVKLTRKDGEQEINRLEFTLPPGLTGRLAGIPYCPDAAISAAEGKGGKTEQASPSCPVASELGSVDTSAGVGSEPIHVGGKVYLAGPYKGAPLSSVVITPAVAGPFDLGNVVVRAPLYVDPETAQITAKSDPIPTILKGIPLKLRSVEIKVSRRDFTLNPTSCEPMAIGATVGGSSGATAKASNRFQVGGCASLPFKPKLKLQLKGATQRVGHPALRAVLSAKPGESGIGRAQVNLPHGEFLDQGNLNKTCTKPVLLAGNCPKSSIYGKARAFTPLLDKPLEGPVYLVGGYGYKLPALVADLNGQIRVTLVGKVDSGKNKGIRNTFEVVPDAPVSRFVLEMKGGKKYGLLENSESLCKAKKAKRRAIVRFTGQNGKVEAFKPVVANQCHKAKKKHKKSKQHGKTQPKGHGKQSEKSQAREVSWVHSLRPW